MPKIETLNILQKTRGKEILRLGEQFREEYRSKVCKKCIRNKKQKERDCSIFHRGGELSCDWMQRAVTKRLMPYNKSYLSDIAMPMLKKNKKIKNIRRMENEGIEKA